MNWDQIFNKLFRIKIRNRHWYLLSMRDKFRINKIRNK